MKKYKKNAEISIVNMYTGKTIGFISFDYYTEEELDEMVGKLHSNLNDDEVLKFNCVTA